MVGRVTALALSLLAGCSFHPIATQSTTDAGPAPDARSGGMPPDAARPSDAASPPPDAAIPDAPKVTGLLSVTVKTMGDEDIDLSEDGTTDWAHWGYRGRTSFDRKVGASAISPLASVPALSFTGAPLTASWNDGTPDGSVDETDTGVGDTEGGTLQFTVAAATTVQTLDLYVGAQDSDERLDLSLSDASAQPVTMTLSAPGVTQNVRYRIEFSAATSGQTLIVRWTDTNDHGGNAFSALLSATLH